LFRRVLGGKRNGTSERKVKQCKRSKLQGIGSSVSFRANVDVSLASKRATFTRYDVAVLRSYPITVCVVHIVTVPMKGAITVKGGQSHKQNGFSDVCS